MSSRGNIFLASRQARRLKNKRKVIVAMSGGVDSSVTAALLKKQGYDLSGVFIIFQKRNSPVIASGGPRPKRSNPKTTGTGDDDLSGLPRRSPRPSRGSLLAMTESIDDKCYSPEAEETARLVVAKLKIPFYVMDFSKEFKKRVIDYFLAEYKKGRTPNPCVMCNQFIKFGLLLDKALALGADFVATGHYIRKRRAKSEKRKTKYRLYEARDKTRDQSYFLYTLTQDKLPHLLFPLGKYLKSEVWQMAKEWGLPVRGTESRGVCFLQDMDIRDFLWRHLRFKRGPIRDVNSQEILGEHQGLPLYTIGQRQAMGIGGLGPYYVTGLDIKKNTLWVTNKAKDPKLFSDSLIAQNINWVSGQEPRLPLSVKARIRYGHQAVKAEVTRLARNKFGVCPGPRRVRQGKLDPKERKYQVKFSKRQRAITPGQAVVFYGQRGELLGGGIIQDLRS